MLPAKSDDRLVMPAAMFALGSIEIGTAAAAVGMDIPDFLTACEAPTVQRQVEAEVLRLKLTGKSSEVRAALALDTLTAKLAAEVESADMLPGTAVRVGEFLLRTSGLEQKRGAELRTTEPEQTFFFAIVNPGDPEPTFPAHAKQSLIIRLDGASKKGKGDAE